MMFKCIIIVIILLHDKIISSNEFTKDDKEDNFESLQKSDYKNTTGNCTEHVINDPRTADEIQEDEEAQRPLTDFEISSLLKYCIFRAKDTPTPLKELTSVAFNECLVILLEFYRIFGKY